MTLGLSILNKYATNSLDVWRKSYDKKLRNNFYIAHITLCRLQHYLCFNYIPHDNSSRHSYKLGGIIGGWEGGGPKFDHHSQHNINIMKRVFRISDDFYHRGPFMVHRSNLQRNIC